MAWNKAHVNHGTSEHMSILSDQHCTLSGGRLLPLWALSQGVIIEFQYNSIPSHLNRDKGDLIIWQYCTRDEAYALMEYSDSLDPEG